VSKDTIQIENMRQVVKRQRIYFVVCQIADIELDLQYLFSGIQILSKKDGCAVAANIN